MKRFLINWLIMTIAVGVMVALLPGMQAKGEPPILGIAAFSLFTQIQIMTQGGPLDSTSTLVFLAVRTGFQQQQTGYASAMSLVFFVLVLAVSLVQRYLTRDKELQR